MVLMEIGAVVRENDVGLEGALELFEGPLDAFPLVGEKALPKPFQHDALPAGAFQERAGAAARLRGALSFPTQHHPAHVQVARLVYELEQRAAAADLDV